MVQLECQFQVIENEGRCRGVFATLRQHIVSDVNISSAASTCHRRRKVEESIPVEVREALLPLVQLVAAISDSI
jgi:hypothetical protein